MSYKILPDITWCPVHHGYLNEDDHVCDQASNEDGEPRACKPVELYVRFEACVGCFQDVEEEGHARGCPTGQNGPPKYD